MAIANLANVPDDDETWDQYSFALQGTLRDINRQILQQKNIALSEYILDPFNIKDPSVQLYGLQTMMNNINAVLDISGYDYEDVDLTKPEERASWTWLLFTNVRKAANMLGVG